MWGQNSDVESVFLPQRFFIGLGHSHSWSYCNVYRFTPVAGYCVLVKVISGAAGQSDSSRLSVAIISSWISYSPIAFILKTRLSRSDSAVRCPLFVRIRCLDHLRQYAPYVINLVTHIAPVLAS